MIKQIKKAITKPLSDESFIIDSIKYQDKCLSIVLDSKTVIDSERIVLATKIISPIIDEINFTNDSYVLDVSSKEKGGNL